MKEKRRIGVILIIVLCVLQILPQRNVVKQDITKQDIIKYSALAAVTVPNPAVFYSFNQSIGTASVVVRQNDTAEGGNTGTIPEQDTEKVPVYVQGKIGKALSLDGTYGLCFYPEIKGNSFTISYWIKPAGINSYAPMLCIGNKFLTEEETFVSITQDADISPVVISASPKGGYFAGKGAALNDQAWNQVCIAVQGESLSIYVNGKQTDSGKLPADIFKQSVQCYLGIDCYNTLYKGALDQLEIYDICLSEEQAAELYEKEKNAAVEGSVTGISLDKNTLILSGAQSTGILRTSLQPRQAENQAVVWKSSDQSIAAVHNGIVTAYKNGTAVITALTQDGTYKAQCSVTVKDIKQLKKIIFQETQLTLQGDSSTVLLVPSAQPAGAALPKLIWSSSAENVAAVDQEGTVSAIANGTCVITAETEDKAYSAACRITVTEVSKEVHVESVKLSDHALSLTKQKSTAKLTTKVLPANAANQQITYYSSDNSVAVVDDTGMVTAVGNGKTDISVISSDGRFTDSCVIKVSGFVDTKVSSITLDRDSMQIAQGDSGYLYAQVKPAAASEVLDWSSNNPDVVDVVADEYGTSAEIIVYSDAVMGSTAVITASSETGVSAECFIEVTEYGVKNLTMRDTSVSLMPGESYNMDAAIQPKEAATAELLWKSSNLKVASVNRQGVVRVKQNALSGQKAKITSMTLSEQQKAACIITVKAKKIPVKKLTTKKKTYSLQPGDTAKFSVSYSPFDATENKITYSSQNPKIVKIDQKGTISVPKTYEGTAEVRVTAKAKSGKKVTALVKVKQKEVKVTRLSISKDSLDVYGGKNTTLYVNYKPINANSANVKWSSSDQNVVRVMGNGKKASLYVKNLSSKGNAIVTARDANGGATAACRVSVLPKPEEVQEDDNSSSMNTGSSDKNQASQAGDKDKEKEKKTVKTISFGNESYVTVKKGKSINLQKRLSISPSDAEYTLTWESKNKYISVTNQGVASVSAKTPLDVQNSILVTTDNGKKAVINIKVQ